MKYLLGIDRDTRKRLAPSYTDLSDTLLQHSLHPPFHEHEDPGGNRKFSVKSYVLHVSTARPVCFVIFGRQRAPSVSSTTPSSGSRSKSTLASDGYMLSLPERDRAGGGAGSIRLGVNEFSPRGLDYVLLFVPTEPCSINYACLLLYCSTVKSWAYTLQPAPIAGAYTNVRTRHDWAN